MLAAAIHSRGTSAGHLLKYKNRWPKKGDIGLVIDERDFAHPTGHRFTILWQDKNVTSHYVERIMVNIIKDDE